VGRWPPSMPLARPTPGRLPLADDPQLRGDHLGRLAVPHRHLRGSVPAAAAVPGGFGLNPFASGLLVLAVFAGNLVMKPMTTPILRRFPFRATLLVNGGLNAACIFGCALLTPATPVLVIAALLFASGLTRSMQFTALNTLAFADVPENWMSGANTLFNMVQQLGMAMGSPWARWRSGLPDCSCRGRSGHGGQHPPGPFPRGLCHRRRARPLRRIDVIGLEPGAGSGVAAGPRLMVRVSLAPGTSPAPGAATEGSLPEGAGGGAGAKPSGAAANQSPYASPLFCTISTFHYGRINAFSANRGTTR